MRARKTRPSETLADPFGEQQPPGSLVRARLLGGEFEFQCGNTELRRIVEWAYKDLPRHRLSRVAPRFRIRLAPAPVSRAQPGVDPAPLGRPPLDPLPLGRQPVDPPRIETLSGAGMLCGATSASDFAVVSADYRSALVVVSQQMLESAYHVRYELIEFAVFTLAARAQGLVPLHAACIGSRRHGILLLGDSGAGKSTAALHCLLRGLEFVAEDSVLVSPQTLQATGVANFLHIRCDSVHRLPAPAVRLIRRSPIIRRRSGVEKYELDLRQPVFRLATRPLPLTGLVFVSAEPARRGSLLSPVRRREALARLRASQPYATGQACWAMFEKRIGAAPAFELRRGRNPAEAADALQALLGHP